MIARLDYLGAGHPKWPVKASIQRLPEGFAVAVLDDEGTFGRCMGYIRKLLKARPDVKHLVSHLHWSAGNHAIIPMDKLARILPEYQQLARDFPGTTIYVSHTLEYNEPSVMELSKRVKLIKDLAPKCVPVNCYYKGVAIEGFITEKHGGSDLKVAAGDILSTDGAAKGLGGPDCDFMKIIRNNTKALFVAAWAPRFNLRQSVEDGGVLLPPKKRVAIPSPRYFSDVASLLLPWGPAPAPTFEHNFPFQPFKGPELWKTFAEDEAKPDGSLGKDPRACLPLFICRQKRPFVQMLACNGKRIGKLALYGPYSGGGWRYYSGHAGGCNLSASEIATKAHRLSGSCWIWLKCDDIIFQPINPVYRGPYFQG